LYLIAQNGKKKYPLGVLDPNEVNVQSADLGSSGLCEVKDNMQERNPSSMYDVFTYIQTLEITQM